jgi:O-antigen ligase
MNKLSQAVRSIAGNEHLIFISLFAFSIPLKNSFSNVIFCVYAFYLIVSACKHPSSFSFDRKNFQTVKYLPLLFLSFLVSLLYSEDLETGWSVVLKSITLLAIPIFFCFVQVNASNKRFVFFSFVWGNFVMFIFNLLRATWRSLHFADGNITFDASVTGGQEFWYSIVQGGNYFFLEQFSYHVHPSYSAVFLLFSSIIILSMYADLREAKWKVLYAIFCATNFVGIFLCSSRIVLAVAAMVLLIFVTIVIHKQRSFLLSMFTVATLIILFAIIIVNSPRFGGYKNLTNRLHFDLRIKSWHAGYEVFKENPVWGAGIGDASNELRTKYKDFHYEENLSLLLNEHNQFLQIANFCGPIGVLMFVLAIGVGLKRGVKSKDYIKIGFISTFTIVCLVECLLARQAGITYFSFFYGFLYSHSEYTDDATQASML